MLNVCAFRGAKPKLAQRLPQLSFAAGGGTRSGRHTPGLEIVTRAWAKGAHLGGTFTVGSREPATGGPPALTAGPTLHLVTGHCGPAGQDRPALKIVDFYWQRIPPITLGSAPVADVSLATSLLCSGVVGDWPRPSPGVAKGVGPRNRNLRERVTRSGCGAPSSPSVPFRVAHLRFSRRGIMALFVALLSLLVTGEQPGRTAGGRGAWGPWAGAAAGGGRSGGGLG